MTAPRILCFALGLLLAHAALAQPVRLNNSGRLEYDSNKGGDTIPDFSSCGYLGGAAAIPDVPPQVVVKHRAGDSTHRIQRALDHVSSLPPDAEGFRGAVVLEAGEHRVSGQLRIHASGVVLRGVGAGPDGTVIVAAGQGRRPLIRVEPNEAPSTTVGKSFPVTDSYTPVGAVELRLAENHNIQANDVVRVTRPSNEKWIELLGAKVLGVGWRAGRQDLHWERTVTKVDGSRVTLDAPITTSLDAEFGGGSVSKLEVQGRLRQVGIEDLALRSDYDSSKPHDEEHSWHGVVANHLQDGWVRRVRFLNFAGGAVLLREATRHVTVEDCLSLQPVSELGGYRRHSFFTGGQQTLFVRCWAEEGVHDFGVGHCAPGPNAFVYCHAHNANGDSGPLESWASGVLYDNVRIDGGDLFFGNRWLDPLGAGWSAANCVAWQCQAAQVHSFQPPGAQNWVLGFWAQPVGDGLFSGDSDFLRPISLYQQQTRERLGDAAAKRVGPFLLDPKASTSPTYEEAEGFVAESNLPKETLRDLIERRMKPREFPGQVEAAPEPATTPPPAEHHPIRIVNGWLTVDGKVLTGGTLSPTWWRGTIRPDDARPFGPSITRFAPGRYGVGLTDELSRVIGQMNARGRAAYDHHYGLWYDRRRDDHLMVRRATAAVAPPFFEQPFARSGQGRAWDGLSRYDLTRYNPWYWDRLVQFAGLCDQHGKALIHQCYFQHNILEAGAHWADCPWRPANNINQTGLPEPPPYIGDKRIFIAHKFYDPQNKPLRELHAAYLRQCVAAFADRHNVIHMTSAEYTGPQEFTEFWLDTIDEHRNQTGAECLLALSATKDVQDALLADEGAREKVDLIDIRYWCYDREGGVYAPPGGANMAPRQHMRQLTPETGDFASVARAVREYRQQHPAKPVMFSAARECRTPAPGWAVLMAGGSLASTPTLPDELAEALVHMSPDWTPGETVLRLASKSGEQLCYFTHKDGQPKLTGEQRLQVRWIDPEKGDIIGEEEWDGGSPLKHQSKVAWISPVDGAAAE